MSASTFQNHNTAGRGLSHVPRRRSGSSRLSLFGSSSPIPAASTSETSHADSVVGPSNAKSESHSAKRRGRTRPQFAFADDDTSTESSAEEDGRGRPSIASSATASRADQFYLEIDANGEAIESESDCQTPTQTNISKFRQETTRPNTEPGPSSTGLATGPSPSKVKIEEDLNEVC